MENFTTTQLEIFEAGLKRAEHVMDYSRDKIRKELLRGVKNELAKRTDRTTNPLPVLIFNNDYEKGSL